MTIKSRLQKLTNKLKPEATKIYFMGWAGCQYKHSNGLTRRDGESKEQFFKRVRENDSNRMIHWFD
jgi:hypothetical protein